MKTVDLRSDTVTRPTVAMREAMAEAPLGDDVFGDDPSVNLLQDRSSELLGKEAALFVPSGTMANQIALRTHTEPGDEIIVEADSHIFLYEGGGFAALSGLSARCVAGQAGVMAVADVRSAVRPPGGLSHYPNSKLLCVENTANRAGGTVVPAAHCEALGEVAREQGLAYHLDGARMFNAAIVQGLSAAHLAAPFDSISFCLSKGLGCPVGSLLVGSQSFIDRAHRFRKMFGGGMRQAGVLAAAGLHALEHHIGRLADDHRRARSLGEGLDGLEGFAVNLESMATNMVYADLDAAFGDAADLVDHLSDRGVLITAVSEQSVRFVSHLDVDDDGISRALQACTSFVAASRASA